MYQRPNTADRETLTSDREGAGFVSGCTGSSVWAGHQTIQQGLDLPSTLKSSTMAEQLAEIGYRGTEPAHHLKNPLSCHYELHIEQGRKLQDQNKSVGIVTGIQGIRWFRVYVTGEQGHAGSTPMVDRADAFLAVARVQIKLNDLALEHSAVATVGVIESEATTSSNTIPGMAHFTMDIRCKSERAIEKIVTGVKAEMKRLETLQSKLVSIVSLDSTSGV